MDMDTAVFLDMCEKLADQNGELTEDQIVIAFMVSSSDLLGKVTPAAVAKGYDEIRKTAMRVINVAEAEGYTVIAEEM